MSVLSLNSAAVLLLGSFEVSNLTFFPSSTVFSVNFLSPILFSVLVLLACCFCNSSKLVIEEGDLK